MHHNRLPALVIISWLLAACATPAPQPTQSPTPAPTAAVATTLPSATPSATPTLQPAPTQAASPTPAARRLLIWAVGVDAQREILITFLEKAAHTSGVDILIVAKTPDALSADLVAGKIAGLDPPDLIWGGADDLFILHRSGILQPALDTIESSALLPATVSGAMIDGKRWGTPIAARGFLLLLYNRKLVSDIPRTTDALLSEARRLNGGGRAGLVAGWVEMRWLEAWLHGFGGQSLDTGGAPALDTPEVIAALELLKDLRRAGPPPPSTYAEGARLFRDGKAAFAIDGEWSLAGYRTYSETLELGYAPLPQISATGRMALGPLEGVYLMYSQQLNDQQRADAQKFAGTLTQLSGQEQIARELGYLPAQLEALESTAVRSDPALAAAAAGVRAAPGIMPSLAQRCVWEGGEALLPALLLGESDASKVAAKLQERALGCLS